MTASQRVASPIVIEVTAFDDLEPRRHVAVAAGAHEPPVMRIGVTGRTVSMGQGFEPHHTLRRVGRCRPGLVTLRAGDVAVHPGEWVVGFGVVEVRRRLPMLHVVTGEAILVQGSSMHVAVTSHTGLLEPDPARGSGRFR